MNRLIARIARLILALSMGSLLLGAKPLQVRPVEDCFSRNAVPSDAPDSADRLQARIDQHQPLPAGTFYVSRPLLLPSNTTVRGAGMESTCIRPLPTSSWIGDINVFEGSHVKNVGIQDLTIVGTGNTGAGVAIAHVTKARIENLRVVDAGTKAINFYGARQVMLRGIRIEGTRGSYGIGFQKGAHQNVILSDIEIFNPAYDGIDIKNRCWRASPLDLDGDNVPNGIDNCPQDPNTDQSVIPEDCRDDECPSDGSTNFGFQLDNIRIRRPGAVPPVDDIPPAGIELRTAAIVSNIYVDKLETGRPAVRIRADLGADRVIVHGLHASGPGVGVWVVDGGWAPFSVSVEPSQMSTAHRCVVTASRENQPPDPPGPSYSWCP